VAVTFDRDPDQIVTPESAAPQLLSLSAKCRLLLECDIDVVLVVPFDEPMAATEPDEFLDTVLGTCCEPVSIHVGRDFRFGARAAGTLDTLYVWAAEHDAEVEPHDLVTLGGEPVTSTRIRALVSVARLAEAAQLLGRAPRVAGVVKRGKERGKEIGFPTANVAPMPYAALPPDGVYAGRALLPDGSSYPAAISVGTPPSFPDARDYLEAHIIGYRGDLYDRTLTLEFTEKLRELRSFDSLPALAEAIAADVTRVAELAALAVPQAPADRFTYHDGEYLESGAPLIDDPEKLAAAERAVANVQVMDAYERSSEEWVPLTGPRHLSGVFANAGFTAALVTAPLESAGIPFAWDPYPPEQMPGYRVGYGAIDRPFTLLVPASRLVEARRLMGVNRTAAHGVSPGSTHGHAASGASPIDHAPPSGPPSADAPEGSEFWRTLVWILIGALFVLWVLTSRGWGG
jgi:riboflavin kinase/FMN adenylyltransferase